jgi:hypothetical protein
VPLPRDSLAFGDKGHEYRMNAAGRDSYCKARRFGHWKAGRPKRELLPRASKLSGTRGTMPHGRSERRIARTLRVQVCLQDETKSNERILTENVSAHGARVFMERRLQPGQQVLVSSPNEGVRSPARIVYCQRLSASSFAVGLELSGMVELWARP